MIPLRSNTTTQGRLNAGAVSLRHANGMLPMQKNKTPIALPDKAYLLSISNKTACSQSLAETIRQNNFTRFDSNPNSFKKLYSAHGILRNLTMGLKISRCKSPDPESEKGCLKSSVHANFHIAGPADFYRNSPVSTNIRKQKTH